jgi:hypothetical protein
VWGLNEARKEVDKVYSTFCKKLMGIPNSAANGFAEMELGRNSRRGKCTGQILKYWYRITCLDTEEPIKQCHKWQKSNMRVRSWTMELKDELCNTELTFMWRKQQDCNLTEIKAVKD